MLLVQVVMMGKVRVRRQLPAAIINGRGKGNEGVYRRMLLLVPVDLYPAGPPLQASRVESVLVVISHHRVRLIYFPMTRRVVVRMVMVKVPMMIFGTMMTMMSSVFFEFSYVYRS